MTESVLLRAQILADDTTICIFDDNTALVLIPSGHAFAHIERESQEIIRQTSHLCLTKYYHKLSTALWFRSQHCDVPTLFSATLPSSANTYTAHVPVLYATWNQYPVVETLADGAYRVVSQEHSAQIVIDRHRQRVQISSLCPLDRGVEPISVTKRKSLKATSDERFEYVWVDTMCTVRTIPKRWHAAVQLILKQDPLRAKPVDTVSVALHKNDGESVDDNNAEAEAEDAVVYTDAGTSVETRSNDILTELPSYPIPLLGSVSERRAHSSLKLFSEYSYLTDILTMVEWCQDVKFRLVPETTEIECDILADRSLLLLSGDGNFFTYFRYDDVVADDAKTEDDSVSQQSPSTRPAVVNNPTVRVFSVAAVPDRIYVSRGVTVSLGDIAKRAVRFRAAAFDPLQRRQKELLESSLRQATVVNSAMIERTEVPNVGLCTAYADGRVTIYFVDRSILEMDGNAAKCSVVLPDGQRVQVTTKNPIGLESHVAIALEFQQWALQTPEQRELQANERAQLQAYIDSTIAETDFQLKVHEIRSGAALRPQ